MIMDLYVRIFLLCGPHHKLIMINGLTKVQNQLYEPVVVCHFFMVVLKEFFTSFGQKKE